MALRNPETGPIREFKVVEPLASPKKIHPFRQALTNLLHTGSDALGAIGRHKKEIGITGTVLIGTGGFAYWDVTSEGAFSTLAKKAWNSIANRAVITDTQIPSQETEQRQAEFTAVPFEIVDPTTTPTSEPATPTATITPTTVPTALPTATQPALVEVTATPKQEKEYKYQINSPVSESEKSKLRMTINTQMANSPSGFDYTPSDLTSPKPVFAVWDGELQPGKADLPGKLVSSIRIRNTQGLEAYYLFDGDIEGDPTLPRKVTAGEKIGTLMKPLPPSPFDPNVTPWLALDFRIPSKSAGTLPIPLDVREFKIE